MTADARELGQIDLNIRRKMLDDHGIDGGKREFMILVKRRFRELDAAGFEEALH